MLVIRVDFVVWTLLHAIDPYMVGRRRKSDDDPDLQTECTS
jgi:hypothetical protein